jgi:hypothetical protein
MRDGQVRRQALRQAWLALPKGSGSRPGAVPQAVLRAGLDLELQLRQRLDTRQSPGPMPVLKRTL